MINIQNKLQNIYNQINSLLIDLLPISKQTQTPIQTIEVLPNRIKQMDVGQNRLKLRVDGSIQEIFATDLKSITQIYPHTLSYCNMLTRITIPENIQSISRQAFEDSNNIADVYMHSTTPPYLSSSFPSTVTIHVPIGSGDAYKSATNWSQYADNIVEDIVIE